MELARDAANDMLARFGIGYVRVWLFDDVAPDAPAAIAAISPGTFHGGLTTSVIAGIRASENASAEITPSIENDPRFVGTFPGNAFVGIPLANDGQLLGYIETYRHRPVSFTEAASMAQYGDSIADIIRLVRATAEMESPGRGTVLVADDDPAIRLLLRRILTKADFRVIDVENGQLACIAALRERPDLILIDWVMPVMDGRQATRILKADPKTRATPIVMLTSQNQIDEKVSALEAGVQDFLAKPVDPRELVARIEQHLRWRRLLAAGDAPSAEPDVAHSDPSEPLPAIEAGGDLWTRAIEAQQMGNLREAVALNIAEAERCDAAKQFSRAALAFRTASQLAGKIANPDLSNKCLRLAGKMYMCSAESTGDHKAIKESYLNAARCFIIAGNVKLAKKSVDMATSMENIMADDRPSAIA